MPDPEDTNVYKDTNFSVYLEADFLYHVYQKNKCCSLFKYFKTITEVSFLGLFLQGSPKKSSLSTSTPPTYTVTG